MLQDNPFTPNHQPSPAHFNPHQRADAGRTGERPLEARVKPDCVHLYPGVDPAIWYAVVQEGEYRDEMEGFWIQVSDRVTFVLGDHFDLQARANIH
jgi:hypothetical protein